MKITFEDGTTIEFSGSAEGGELSEKEQELAKNVIEYQHQERMKSFEENCLIQVEIAKVKQEMSKAQQEMARAYYSH